VETRERSKCPTRLEAEKSARDPSTAVCFALAKHILRSG
jgi:hypothetical protein